MKSLELSIGGKATLALVWEATAPKPGNVHRGADFEDMTFADMVAAAVATGPAFEQDAGVGHIVLDAVERMRRAVGKNTHLGSLLLFAPLAAAQRMGSARHSLTRVLRDTSIEDAELVYEAIRLAAPGGLGVVEDQDVASRPTLNLAAAMKLAADRDLVAKQYAESFEDVKASAALIMQLVHKGHPLGDAVVAAHVGLMSKQPDTLIARKCGSVVAGESAARAAAVIAAGPIGEDRYLHTLSDLDFWLRSDGHNRNPGATADVIAAAIFYTLLIDGMEFPVRF